MTDEPVRLASVNGQQLGARVPGASPSTGRFPQPGDHVPGAPPPLEGTAAPAPSVESDASTISPLPARARRASATDRRAVALVLAVLIGGFAAVLIGGFAAIQIFRRDGNRRSERGGSRAPAMVRTPPRGTR